MMQTPVNYCATPMATALGQPSYNAVKIDIHNPKVADGPQCYPSPYNMPMAPYYNYPQAMPCFQPIAYPMMPQINPNVCMPQPMTCPCIQPQPVAQEPQPVPVVPAPVQQTPVQQVINNGVPAQQTIQQTPAQPQQVVTPVVPPQPAVTTAPVQQNTPVTVAPAQTIPVADISPVLKGLQSNNLAEQSAALNKIGEAADNPKEVNKFLETSVMDALLGILNADTKGLATATPEQIEARTKMVNNKPVTDAEKNLAMTLAPQEVAEGNKQHALYSISILQKALANAIEEKTGEKLSIEKLPAIDQVVNVVKTNPSPLLRSSAIVALAHLDKPEYKPVLSEIFQLAQNDQDPNVKQVATEALNKINTPAK